MQLLNAKNVFKNHLEKKFPTQKYGNEKIKRNGEEIDLRDFLNENSEGTTVYETLENYGSIKHHKRPDISEIAENIQGLDDRSITEKIRELEKNWTMLPREIREQFNNDVKLFIDTGNDWAKNVVEQKQKEIEQLQKIEAEKAKTNKGDINNE